MRQKEKGAPLTSAPKGNREVSCSSRKHTTQVRLRAIPRNIVVETKTWDKDKKDYGDWLPWGYYTTIESALRGVMNAGIGGDDVAELSETLKQGIAAVRAVAAGLPASLREDLRRVMESDERAAERGAKIAEQKRLAV